MKRSRFRRLADTHGSVRFDLAGFSTSEETFRTTRWLVPTTFPRGKDDHHGARFLWRCGEFYFQRSEFWTTPGQSRFPIATSLLLAKFGVSKGGDPAEWLPFRGLVNGFRVVVHTPERHSLPLEVSAIQQGLL